MPRLNINIGLHANDKTGDSVRSAFAKINANFTELYHAIASASDTLVVGNIVLNGTNLTTQNNNLTVAGQTVTTNVLHNENGYRIETRSGFTQVSVSALSYGQYAATVEQDVVNSFIYTVSWNDAFYNDYYQEGDENVVPDSAQMSFDDSTWFNIRVAGTTGSQYIHVVDNDEEPRNVPAGTIASIRWQNGGSAARWFHLTDDHVSGFRLEYHGFIENEGGNIIGACLGVGEDTLVQSDTWSGSSTGMPGVDMSFIYDTSTNRSLWFRRTDGRAGTLNVQWTATIFFREEE